MAHILIIDTEDSAVAELKRALKKHGHTADRVSDTPGTFTYLRQRIPQLFILDLMAAIRGRPSELPEGVRLLAQLYLDHPEVPMIVYSRSRKYRKQFWSWAAAAHISKRDGIGEVMKVVDRLLGESG